MKIIARIIVFGLFTLGIGVSAQQLPQFTQYMYNTISINPAYAGSRDALAATALHRSQWSGFQGGPSTTTISINTPLRDKRVGLGLSFINDHLGYENFSYLYGDFSYTVRTAVNTRLAFGLKAGLTHYSIDTEFLTNPDIMNDPFFNDVSDRWSPNVGVGAYWYSDKWYLGLSAPRILNTDYNNGGNGNIDYVALERVSYYLTGGYVFALGASTKLKPAFLVKATNGAPLSLDGTLNFLFYERLWLGASYRYNESAGAIGALADFQVSEQLRLGYAYEHSTSDIRSYSSGTHEFLLIYEFKFYDSKLKSSRYF